MTLIVLYNQSLLFIRSLSNFQMRMLISILKSFTLDIVLKSTPDNYNGVDRLSTDKHFGGGRYRNFTFFARAKDSGREVLKYSVGHVIRAHAYLVIPQ